MTTLSKLQLSTLKDAINFDAAIAAPRIAGDTGALAAYLNSPALDGFVWRPSVTAAELNAIIQWDEFLTLPVANQNAYIALITPGTIDGTNQRIRDGLAAIFLGTQTALNLMNALARTPTRFESFFTDKNVCPVVGKLVSIPDVLTALGA